MEDCVLTRGDLTDAWNKHETRSKACREGSAEAIVTLLLREREGQNRKRWESMKDTKTQELRQKTEEGPRQKDSAEHESYDGAPN